MVEAALTSACHDGHNGRSICSWRRCRHRRRSRAQSSRFYHAVLAALVNDGVAEFVSTSIRPFILMGTVLMQDGNEAAKELVHKI